MVPVCSPTAHGHCMLANSTWLTVRSGSMNAPSHCTLIPVRSHWHPHQQHMAHCVFIPVRSHWHPQQHHMAPRALIPMLSHHPFVPPAEEVDARRREGAFFGEFIDARGVVSRISQHNGFGLLLCAFIMFLWLVLRCAPHHVPVAVNNIALSIVVKSVYVESGVWGGGERVSWRELMPRGRLSLVCLLLKLRGIRWIESFSVFQILPNHSRIINPKQVNAPSLACRYIFVVFFIPYIHRWVTRTEERNAATGGGGCGCSCQQHMH